MSGERAGGWRPYQGWDRRSRWQFLIAVGLGLTLRAAAGNG